MNEQEREAEWQRILEIEAKEKQDEKDAFLEAQKDGWELRQLSPTALYQGEIYAKVFPDKEIHIWRIREGWQVADRTGTKWYGVFKNHRPVKTLKEAFENERIN